VDAVSDDADLAGPERASPSGRPAGSARIGRTALALVGVVVVYYAVPVDELPSSWDIAGVTLALVAGLGALVWVGVRQVSTLAHHQAGDRSVRLDVLALVLIVVVPLFALGFYAIEQADVHQFAGLDTKTDALYFTMSTLATVGFGDVHAVGQLARALVTIQIVFNLVFVAALVSILTGQIRERAAVRHAALQRAPDDPASPRD
jgi:voltage-gated potassium channel